MSGTKKQLSLPDRFLSWQCLRRITPRGAVKTLTLMTVALGMLLPSVPSWAEGRDNIARIPKGGDSGGTRSETIEIDREEQVVWVTYLVSVDMD